MSCGELLRLRLPCDPSAPRLAREALGAVAEIAPVRDDALLVASELTTNAVMHSGCVGDDDFELWADCIRDGLRITVLDVGRSGDDPVRRIPDSSRPGGMGLAVVEQIAKRWGAERDGELRVWAELTI
jgi:anti-sigma regulatory factor (Ser/Thr protein kinase)